MEIIAINSLQKEQIKSLFSQAFVANISILATGVLVLVAFIYEKEIKYLEWFSLVLIASITARLYIAYSFKKNTSRILYSRYVNNYVIASLFIGISWGYLTLTYYDLQNNELRIFLTIVNLALVTAAVGSLAVWIRAYIAFSLPQMIALMAVFILNNNFYVAVAMVVFTLFMFKVAINFNVKLKESYVLIHENSELIENMDVEIQNRKLAQESLEQSQEVLEELVKERTGELLEINIDLEKQIDKRKKVEQDLEVLAYYDSLTNLPNRSLLIERIKQAVSYAKRKQSLFSVLFVDLDRFKAINDSLGHDIGDKLLSQVALRLQQLLRDSDTIARNGGDEFVILIEEINDIREVFVVAEKIIKSINNNFEIVGHNVHIGASIGISIYPLDGTDALELLKKSDTAMYCAKEEGANHFEFYSNEMSNQIKDRLELENSLRTAIKNEEFYLVYQPQINVKNKEVSGLEALIRWQSPKLGLVPPFKFIPVLEETGLIYPVGEWVIAQVIEFIKSGKAKNAKVSINLSALQCTINLYAEKIIERITKAGIDPKMIEFEITESLLINDIKKTEKFLTGISEFGCSIALDDFGTGYTSFGYLAKLPIDIIKIDRSMITGIDQNKNLQDIVRAIVTMSQSLGIENVFEGVETEEELEMVKSLNGSIIQGYLFSKPLEVSSLGQWFEKSDFSSSI